MPEENDLGYVVSKPNEDGWVWGYWNGSERQIKISVDRPFRGEDSHSYKFPMYYQMFNGELVLDIKGKEVKISGLESVLILPNTPHKITKKSDKCSYVIIKDQSYPNNKNFVKQ